ncbi:heat shock 70 kDa protein 16-like isoform X2 [Prosopis cineraria]|uniref:heat shock 70 kDa protein 16-like isoform X2 n=1 Tax=Prosopis cineraria TaxID=364024 RepID=UPI002410AD31|nr:heat shock 70 kDa protein 16-like isoform X2 [Prosopis cineraria]
MSVVGFDIGNENCVISVVKQRGIDVLLNDESKRETPSVVCFAEKQRFLGSAGAASAMMNIKSTISQVKRLMGRKHADPDVQKELEMLPVETSEGPDGGILVHLKYLKETHTFTPVQILAMLLAHLKILTEKDLEMSVSDCVIGVPSYFSDLQRRAYLDAARIAGLRPLRLIHDCTATALGYGIYKADFPGTGPTYVAFVDIGHCDTQVSIAAFEPGKMKILSHAFDSNLGGRDFDEVLFSHFAAQFKEQYSIDVYSNVKACIRLRAACEKLKKVLSANHEAALNIECLMDEKDVKGFIKREEYEKLASGLLEKICVPCHKALVDARLNAERIHSVELVGSGSRIPAIARLLTSQFRREPSRTLNASECVARGCALQCAMLSPVFRVREYEVLDLNPFSIGFSSDDGPITAVSNGILFPKGQLIPSIKILTFHRSSLFHLEAFYADPNELPPGTSPKISCFTLIEDQVDDIKGNDHSYVESMDVDPSTDETVSNGVEDSKHRNDEFPYKSADAARRDKTTKRHVPVSENIYGGMTKAEISEAREKELLLAQQDRAVERTKEKKNSLESYIYEMRNKLFGTYRSFASEQEREGISRSLQETEEWLYEDGDDETEAAYSEKLEDIKKLVDPIENRYRDEAARVQATRDLLKCIADHRMSASSFLPQDKESIINECNKAEQWLRENLQQQDSLPKDNDPIIWSNDIISKAEDLKLLCQQVLGSKGSSTTPEDKGRDKPDASIHP